VKMLHITLFTFFQMLLLVGDRCLLRDPIPLPRSSQRTHLIKKNGNWVDLLRVSPVLNVDLKKQKLNGLRRESLHRLGRRSRTRLAHTRGPSRWRANVACGRRVRNLQTRAQQQNGEVLLCKHLVRFHREEDMRKSGEAAEEKGDEEEGTGWMEVAGEEMEEEEERRG